MSFPTKKFRDHFMHTYAIPCHICQAHPFTQSQAVSPSGRACSIGQFQQVPRSPLLWSSLLPFADRRLHGGLVEGVTRPTAIDPAPSVPEHPAGDAPIPLISAILGKRLLVPELVRRRPVRQLEQQRGADVVGAVGRADRSAEDEAVAVRGEV